MSNSNFPGTQYENYNTTAVPSLDWSEFNFRAVVNWPIIAEELLHPDQLDMFDVVFTDLSKSLMDLLHEIVAANVGGLAFAKAENAKMALNHLEAYNRNCAVAIGKLYVMERQLGLKTVEDLPKLKRFFTRLINRTILWIERTFRV